MPLDFKAYSEAYEARLEEIRGIPPEWFEENEGVPVSNLVLDVTRHTILRFLELLSSEEHHTIPELRISPDKTGEIDIILPTPKRIYLVISDMFFCLYEAINDFEAFLLDYEDIPMERVREDLILPSPTYIARELFEAYKRIEYST